MVDITKLDMTDIWASSGDKTAPDPSKIATGWIVEVVPRQWWNWFENRQDQNIAYMLQKGIPEWDSFTEYLINKSYVQRNNIVYKCIQTGTNKDPATAPLYWVKAFPESSASLESIRKLTPAADRVAYFTGANSASLMTVTALARTLLDDDNVTTMRSTLGAQASNTNLTALSGATAATNTFPYWNSATTMLASPITAFGRSLIDDADAEAARTTLGLGTGAVVNVTTSATDTTAGRVLKVGDFGIGTDSQPTNIDPNTVRYGSVMAPVSQANAPTAECIIWTGARNGGARAAQFAVDHNSAASSWIRSYNSGRVGSEWGAWAEVWSTNNLVKTTSATDTTTGRMLKVGDFGLGSLNTPILASLNDTTTAVGFYAANNSTVGLPAGVGYGLVTVVRYPSTDNIAQELIVPGNVAGDNNRKFFRAYNATASAWRAWNEYYHTGNSAQMVADVTAGIQPTLDAKVNKTGGTMTGPLVVPFIGLGSTSATGYLDLHAGTGGNSDYDARIYAASGQSGVVGGGQMRLLAASVLAQANMTVTGTLGCQSNISASGNVSGVNLSASGTLTATGATTLNNTLTVNNATTINNSLVVTSAISCLASVGAKGRLLVTSADSGNTDNVHLYFANYDGTVRAVIYAAPDGAIIFRAGANTFITIRPNGTVSLGANTDVIGALNVSGRIKSDYGLSAGAATLSTDGNVNGSLWGGWLNDYLNRVFLQPSNLMANIAAQGVGGIGTYAFLRNNSAATVGPGGQVAGTSLQWADSSSGTAGAVGYGSWLCMGHGYKGNSTVWMRYA